MSAPETHETKYDASRERFLSLVRESLADRGLIKLTLGKYRGPDKTLKNLYVRPVNLKAGPGFAFLWRHASRDITRNLDAEEAYDAVESLVGSDFLDAHLFSKGRMVQLQSGVGEQSSRLRIKNTSEAGDGANTVHDREKHHLIPVETAWLRALGIVGENRRPLQGQAPKFKQINHFSEIIKSLVGEAFDADSAQGSGASAPSGSTRMLRVVDMGSGKGYLTFALATLLGERARVEGIERREDLVRNCNGIATSQGFGERLRFRVGAIADCDPGKKSDGDGPIDILVALHACDTATDDAIAVGIAAKCPVIVVAPCCHKELRPQLGEPPELGGALRHGLFRQRESEFVTDALRALLLEWAGYRTRVLEFVSVEHTAKNLMIAAVRVPDSPPPIHDASGIRRLARTYGVRHQHLASLLGVALSDEA